MSLSKRTALGVSLGSVAGYWIYLLVSQRVSPVLPADFGELALRLVRSKLIVFAALFVLLRLEGEGFSALGLARREWRRHAGLGLAIGFAMFLLFNVGLDSAMNSLLPRPPASGPSIMSYFSQPANLLMWLPIGIFGGGVVEELQRIFVITRFEKWLGRPGLVLGVVLSSAMFGFGHRYQGPGVAIGTAISGTVLALVYLRRRSALEPIVAHAFSDVLAMVAATMLAGH
jgi:uncharacterized protein